MQMMPYLHNQDGVCYVLDKPYPDGKVIGIHDSKFMFKALMVDVCRSIIDKFWEPHFKKFVKGNEESK